MDSKCIFCKIINKEIPANILYEDDLVIVFMDIAPINKGHLLVVPKEHITSTGNVSEELGGRMFYVASRFAVACLRAFETDGHNFHLADGTAAGQEVPHIHLHVIPRKLEDNFHWNWRKLEMSMDEFEEAATEIKAKLTIESK